MQMTNSHSENFATIAKFRYDSENIAKFLLCLQKFRYIHKEIFFFF